MSSNKKSEDLLEGFFKEITEDMTSSESPSDFARRMQDSVQESLQKNGYQDISDLITKSVESAVRYVGPEAGLSGYQRPERVKDGFTFVQNELAQIRYDMRKRGAFRDGHQEALRVYFEQMEESRKNLQAFEEIIRSDLKERKKRMKKRDRYGEGYNAALEDLLRILGDAKKFMMQRVKNDLMKVK